MPAKNLCREHEEGIYSHIYNKGVENKIIFNDEEDYKAFLGFLKDYLTVPQDPESIKKSFVVHGRIFRGTPHQPKNYFNKVELIAYSLTPNHFHLLLLQKTQGSLESFIRSLCTRYSIYFNKKYQRSGALFEGPYKSAQIKDELCMLYLTRYLHRTTGPSSYAQYLGEKVTPWVKPEVAQSFFDKVKKDLPKRVDSYKDFVEEYEPDQKVKELLEDITFESEIQHLERINPTKNAENYSQKPQPPREPFEKIRLNQNLKLPQRIPEILAAAAVFLLLFAFGIRNVMISTVKSSNPSAPSVVLSASNEIKPTVSVTNIPDSPASSSDHLSLDDMLNISTSSAIPSNPSTSSASLSASNNIEPIVSTSSAGLLETQYIIPQLLTIKASGSASVNIYQQPTINAKIIGLAKNGDIFEFVSADQNWYEVKLTNGLTGFISATYVVVNGGNK